MKAFLYTLSFILGLTFLEISVADSTCTSNVDCSIYPNTYCCNWGCCSSSQYYSTWYDCSLKKSCPGRYDSFDEMFCCGEKCCRIEEHLASKNTTQPAVSVDISCNNDDSNCPRSGDDNSLSYCCEDHCCDYNDKFIPVCFTNSYGVDVRCGSLDCCGTSCCSHASGSNDLNAYNYYDCFVYGNECPRKNQDSSLTKCCSYGCCSQSDYDDIYNPQPVDYNKYENIKLPNYDTDSYSSNTSDDSSGRALWSVLGVVLSVVFTVVLMVVRYRHRCNGASRGIGRVNYDEDELLPEEDNRSDLESIHTPTPHLVAVVIETEEAEQSNDDDEPPPPPYEEVI